ncbi:MAG: patatin-like phospholipase family protein [Candidatus Omnitrophica bacterium]|nr:patatin-like phospholipase family protein [Candidatus Omnitrophota bacterium]
MAEPIMPLHNIIKQIPVFSDLNWFDIQKIAGKAAIEEYKKGAFIRKQGDPPDFFYCLVSGRLQAYTADEKGRIRYTDYLYRGMYFGIISSLTGQNHTLTFEALNDSVVLKIPKGDFQEIIKKIPKLGIFFSQSLSRRIRRAVGGEKIVFESMVISVYGPLSGTGSSTYALNLALSLKRQANKRVIFIDMNIPRNNVAGKEKTPYLKSSPVNFRELASNPNVIQSKIVKDDLGIDTINILFDRHDAEIRKKISLFISNLFGEYSHIVVDLPNEIDEIILETLVQSDLLHIITYDRENDLEQTKKVIDKMRDTLKDNFKQDKVKVLIRSLEGIDYTSFDKLREKINFDVYKKLPQIAEAEFNQNVESNQIVFCQAKEGGEYAKAVNFIARQISGTLVGLALGGGAALGVAHIGVIKALEKEQITIDVISGSSMGALIGSLWATGRNYPELEEIAREFKHKPALMKLFDPVLPISGFIGGRAISRWLRKHLGDRTFNQNKIPLKVVALDLGNREDIIIEEGSVVDAVRKSVAIPGIIEPVMDKGRTIIDGGVLNPLPIDVLAKSGVRKIIAVNVLQSPEDVAKHSCQIKNRIKLNDNYSFLQRPLSFILKQIKFLLSKFFKPTIADIIVNTLQASEYVIARQSEQQADINIHPDLADIDWYELYRVDDLIKKGEEAAYKAMPQIRKLVSE